MEHPSTYVVQDREDIGEMRRLEIQDDLVTTGMGGVLPEQADPTLLRRVLDVGCGTGGWLMEVARTYPMIERLVGVDVSSSMLAYVRQKAEIQSLEGRVQFETMDALRILPFPANFFDLVNQRFGASWLRHWDWRKILLEYRRVCRPGGVIRITESEIPLSNSPALTQLCDIGLSAFYHSGRFWTRTSDGVTHELTRLLTQHAIGDVHSQAHTLVIGAGTEGIGPFYEDMALGFRLLLPFFHRWTRVPIDYQDIYQQALKEMRQSNFEATWRLVTAWGTKPLYGEPLLMRGLL
jgi:ubiquinone/menaquinone biosynthesis C-methylase UbiE